VTWKPAMYALPTASDSPLGDWVGIAENWILDKASYNYIDLAMAYLRM